MLSGCRVGLARLKRRLMAWAQIVASVVDTLFERREGSRPDGGLVSPPGPIGMPPFCCYKAQSITPNEACSSEQALSA
jgi:hypothetical protein